MLIYKAEAPTTKREVDSVYRCVKTNKKIMENWGGPQNSLVWPEGAHINWLRRWWWDWGHEGIYCSWTRKMEEEHWFLKGGRYCSRQVRFMVCSWSNKCITHICFWSLHLDHTAMLVCFTTEGCPEWIATRWGSNARAKESWCHSRITMWHRGFDFSRPTR